MPGEAELESGLTPSTNPFRPKQSGLTPSTNPHPSRSVTVMADLAIRIAALTQERRLGDSEGRFLRT